MKSLAINNALIFDGNEFIGEGGVLAEDGIITAVGGHYDAEFVFDARGAILSPGLIDVHTHFNGLTPKVYCTSADCACLPFGVTAAADCGGNLGNTETFKAFSVKCLVFAGISVSPDGEPQLDDAEARIERYGDRALGFKVVLDVGTPGGIKPLEKTVRRARALGKKVTVHTTGSSVPMAEIAATLGEGDILTHAYHGGRNSAADDGFACLKEAKRRGVIVDAGMAGHVHTDFRILREAIAAGALPDVIGTDVTRLSTYTRGGKYGMTMCMSIARDLGMPEQAVFKAVTSSAASALGRGSFPGASAAPDGNLITPAGNAKAGEIRQSISTMKSRGDSASSVAITAGGVKKSAASGNTAHSEAIHNISLKENSGFGAGEGWGSLAVGSVADLAVIGRDGSGYDLTDAAGNHVSAPKGYECLLTVLNGEVTYLR